MAGVVEEEGERQTESGLADDGGTGDEDDGIPDEFAEVGDVAEGAVIVETDELGAGGIETEESLVGETEVDGPESRKDEEEGEDERGGEGGEEVGEVG